MVKLQGEQFPMVVTPFSGGPTSCACCLSPSQDLELEAHAQFGIFLLPTTADQHLPITFGQRFKLGCWQNLIQYPY